METELYLNYNGPCAYLDDRKWITRYFFCEQISPDFYESLICGSWRRCGQVFYQNICPDCSECIPLRVDVNKFQQRKSHRRVVKRNADLKVTVSPADFQEADYQLYRKYILDWHQSDEHPSKEDYLYFLASPLETLISRYYFDDVLIGIGWIDVLPDSLSSVYFAFDPDFKERRLGTFSILQEIEMSKQMEKSWLHLGFFVKGCGKMSYKADFKPCQFASSGDWLGLDNSE